MSNKKEKGGFYYDGKFITWQEAGNNYDPEEEERDNFKKRFGFVPHLLGIMLTGVGLLTFGSYLVNANYYCKTSPSNHVNCKVVESLYSVLLGN
jgi:hypothetical protein